MALVTVVPCMIGMGALPRRFRRRPVTGMAFVTGMALVTGMGALSRGGLVHGDAHVLRH